jgi:multiple sugar transport system substrate-binding protein
MNRMTRRRVVAVGMATGGMGAFALAAGCGAAGTESAPSAPQKLAGQVRFLHPPDVTYVGPLAKVTDQFQRDNPGAQISLEPSPNWSDSAKFIASAVAGDAPDLLWATETTDAMYFLKGVIQPLDGFITKDKQFKVTDYFDTVIAEYKANGRQLGLPLLWGAYVIYYNKAMFAQAGRKPPDETWTWDTFLEAAKALTKPASDPATMGNYGFELRNHFNVWMSWVWNTGGDLFSQDGLKCVFDSPEAVEAMQFVVDLMHRYKVAPTAKELADRNLGSNAFGTGKVAMVSNAIYYLPTYRQSDVPDWEIAPVPKGKKGRWTANPTSGLVMWSGTKVPDVTWAYMRHLISEPSARTYITEGMNGMPVNRAAAQLILQDPRPPKNKQLFFDAFTYAKPAFTTPYGNAAWNVLAAEMKPMWDTGEPANKVLKDAAARVNAQMQSDRAREKQ